MKYYQVFCVNEKRNWEGGGGRGWYNIRMLEITIDNCFKCDLERINDPNNSQYFWINRRDLEIKTKGN